MTKTARFWGIGCLIYGIVLVILSMLACAITAMADATSGEGAEPALAVVFGALLLWLAGSIPGFIVLAQKKYLAWFGAVGCIVWLLVGWWAFPLLFALGPITWAGTLLLVPRRACSFCQKIISGKATRCPNCTSEVEPIA